MPALTPFTLQDLNNNNGFLTYVWGPGFWMTLHTISLNYPTRPTAAQRRQYRAFFDSLQHVLPCGKCRDNLVNNLTSTQYGKGVFRNRDTLSRWVYDLHTCVNTMLGKTTDVSYDKMRRTYEHFRARCGMSDTSDIRSGTKSDLAGGGRGGSRRRMSPSRAMTSSHSGCTEPATGIKSKCLLRIVPVQSRSKTMKVDKRCLCRMGMCNA